MVEAPGCFLIKPGYVNGGAKDMGVHTVCETMSSKLFNQRLRTRHCWLWCCFCGIHVSGGEGYGSSHAALLCLLIVAFAVTRWVLCPELGPDGDVNAYDLTASYSRRRMYCIVDFPTMSCGSLCPDDFTANTRSSSRWENHPINVVTEPTDGPSRLTAGFDGLHETPTLSREL